MNGICFCISETLSIFPVKGREVEEQCEAGAGGSEEIVGRNVELSGDPKNGGAEEVDDDGEDGGITRDRLEGMADVRVAES